MADSMTDLYLDNNSSTRVDRRFTSQLTLERSRSNRASAWRSWPAWTRGSTWRICSACRRATRTSSATPEAW